MDEQDQIKAAQKDSKQFEPLYNLYYLPVFRFVLNRTANKDIAGEITSIVFVKVLENIGSYKYTGAKFSSWLFRIAYNALNDMYRVNKINRTVSIDSNTIEVLSEEINNYSALRSEQLKQVIDVMPELTPEEISLLELRYFENRKFKEVAEALSLTEENARVKVLRLITKMKKMLVLKK